MHLSKLVVAVFLIMSSAEARADTMITAILNVENAVIETGAVDTRTMASDAVDSAKILNGAVNTGKLASDAVQTGKLMTDSVSDTKILNGSVGTGKLATDSVGTSKLITDSVSNSKILNSAVEPSKLHSQAINDSSKVASFARFDSYGQSSVKSTFTVTQGSMTVRGGAATLFVDATASNLDGQIIFNSATGGANMFWQFGGANQWGGLIRAGGFTPEHFTFYNYAGGSMNIGTSVAAPSSLLHVRGSITQDTVLNCANGITTNAAGTMTGCAVSDARLKKNVRDWAYDLSLFDKLRPVSYEWVNYELAPATVTYKLIDGKTLSKKATGVPAKVREAADSKVHRGLVAQEVEALFPEAINGGGYGDLKAIDNYAMAAILIQAVKDLRARVAVLEAR